MISDELSMVKVKNGDDGIAGKDGVGLVSTQIMYAGSDSGTVKPTTGWTAAVPTLAAGKYLWTETTWLYSDNTGEAGYSVSRIGKDGNTGKDGVAGKDGVGISNTVIEYVGAVSGTSKPTSGWSTTIPTVPQGQYLWTRTTWTYTDGTTEQGYSAALMGPKGDKGDTGDDGQTPVVHPAWSWSPDGTDRFCTVYPGENAFLDSEKEITNGDIPNPEFISPYWLDITSLIDKHGLDQWYTISFDLASKDITNSNQIRFYPYPGSPLPGKYLFSTKYYTVSTEYQRFSLSFKPTLNNPDSKQSRIAFYGTYGSGNVPKIKRIKFEVGDTPTIYTPTPSEDYANAYPLYEGTYTDYSETASQNPADYTWRRIIGEGGQDGVAGADGKGIKSTAVTYQASTSGTTAPTGTWVANPPTVTKGQYLWTRTIWTYTDDTTELGYSVAYLAKDGNNGTDGIAGKDGVGIKSTAITYAVSSSGTTAPTSGWVASPPTATAGQFMWTRTVWTYTDNTTETGYSVGKIGNNGTNGKDGEDGSNGISVASVTEEYYVSTSATTQTGGEWSTTVPNNANPNLYVWRRVKNTMSDGTVSYTTPALIQGMTGIYPYIGPTQPANPKEGQQWWVTDGTEKVIAFKVYHDGDWGPQTIQQSVLNILELNAVDINGSNVTGTHISGSEFVNDFDTPVFDDNQLYIYGTTTIGDAGVVIDGDYYWSSMGKPEAGGNYEPKRVEISAKRGGLYVSRDFTQSPEYGRWIQVDDNGIKMYDGDYAMRFSTGTVNLRYQDFMTVPVTQLSPETNYSVYATSGNSQPVASRNGRSVQLSGAFKPNVAMAASSSPIKMGSLPIWARPARTVTAIAQGSSMNRFLLQIEANGDITWQRYGTSSSIDVPAGAWLNISCTYSAADL